MGPSDAQTGPRSSRGAEQRPPRRPGPPVLRARSVLTCPPHYPGEPPGLRRLKIRARRPSPFGRRVGARDDVSRPAQGSLSLGPPACQPSQGRQLSGRLHDGPLPCARSYGGVPSTPPAGLSPARTRRLCTAHYQIRQKTRLTQRRRDAVRKKGALAFALLLCVSASLREAVVTMVGFTYCFCGFGMRPNPFTGRTKNRRPAGGGAAGSSLWREATATASPAPRRPALPAVPSARAGRRSGPAARRSPGAAPRSRPPARPSAR